MVFLVAAVLQVAPLVLVIFLVWCVIVALIDNVLKPLLLGRGVAGPIAVVFLGAIGGFVSLGTVTK